MCTTHAPSICTKEWANHELTFFNASQVGQYPSFFDLFVEIPGTGTILELTSTRLDNPNVTISECVEPFAFYTELNHTFHGIFLLFGVLHEGIFIFVKYLFVFPCLSVSLTPTHQGGISAKTETTAPQ